MRSRQALDFSATHNTRSPRTPMAPPSARAVGVPRVSALAPPPPAFQPSGLDLFLAFAPPESTPRPKYALVGPPPLRPTPSTYFKQDAFSAARADPPPLLEEDGCDDDAETNPVASRPGMSPVSTDVPPPHTTLSPTARTSVKKPPPVIVPNGTSGSSTPTDPVLPSPSSDSNGGSFSSNPGSMEKRPGPGSSTSSSVVSKLFGGGGGTGKRGSFSSMSSAGGPATKASMDPPSPSSDGRKTVSRNGSFISFLAGSRAKKEQQANNHDAALHPRTSELHTARADPAIKLDDWYGGGKADSFEYGMRQGQHVFVPDNEPLEKASVPEKGLEFQAKARDHVPKILLELKSHQADA